MKRRYGSDRGQVAVEFTGMVPVVLGTVILLWQAALVGYTYALAGNAADVGARVGTVSGDGACQAAARGSVSGAWTVTASCGGGGADLYTASVTLNVPVLFPGLDIPVQVEGHAAVAWEGER
ncbi:pilus assembly protein [Streptomyces ficellus]|uniref:Pilus assembly protein n=1 Tax=Streptomyces ficellus TaxID=1977088 RepID=A0ABT7ZB17_9ACTN|nr:TadE family protein [Streptomyces ficellus]MDN3296633.1 pilus assembly protein [Streptomyces ficellus]